MKKFTTVFMTLIIMLMVVLTGCSTFSIDKVKYYNEVVAKVGGENITRFDLVNAYNNYGYTNYVTQMGQSEREAISKTMDTLVQRKLVVKYAKDSGTKYALNQYELKKLFRDTLDSVLESFKTNKDTARKIYNLPAKESDVTDPETKESFKRGEYNYEKRVEIEEGQIRFKDTNLYKDEDLIEPSIDSKYITNFAGYTQAEIVNALLEQFKTEFYSNLDNEDAVAYKKVCDKAIELSCNNLINYEYYLRENGKRLSTNQQDLLFRFVERTYESELENAYITKVQNVYMQEDVLSNSSVENAFKALYKRDYAKYANDAEAYYEKITSTGTSGAELIYYTPNSDAEFGYFLHVLLPFDDYVKAELDYLKQYRQDWFGSDAQAYKNAQMELVNQIMCAQRTLTEIRDDETGEVIAEEGTTLDDKVLIGDVLNEYNATVSDLNSFINFMFKYSTDNATLTADMPYVIGYDTEKYEVNGSELTGAYSTMVTNFTKEAIRLMQNDQRFTKYNEYILTNYGVHLLYYVAPVVNQFSVQDIDSITVKDLDAEVLNMATGETYLDRIFDLVYPEGTDGMFTSNTKYSDFETILIESLYGEYNVKLYETKIKASTKI